MLAAPLFHGAAAMKLTQLFLDQLEREAPRTRHALESVPRGKDDWAPHAKSMPLLRLAGLVASMPSWIALIINQHALELSPAAGQGQYQQPAVDGLVATLDKAVQDGRAALQNTTDDYLLTTNWKLLVKGNVVMDQPRHVVLVDTFSHLAHHRGQLTVYLRLNDQPVPAIYGPSADDQHFA
jgi:uncharacterized damage-inducible protein DinB